MEDNKSQSDYSGSEELRTPTYNESNDSEGSDMFVREGSTTPGNNSLDPIMEDNSISEKEDSVYEEPNRNKLETILSPDELADNGVESDELSEDGGEDEEETEHKEEKENSQEDESPKDTLNQHSSESMPSFESEQHNQQDLTTSTTQIQQTFSLYLPPQTINSVKFLPTNFDRQITKGLKLTGEPYVAFDVAVQTNESWLWHWHVLQMHDFDSLATISSKPEMASADVSSLQQLYQLYSGKLATYTQRRLSGYHTTSDISLTGIDGTGVALKTSQTSMKNLSKVVEDEVSEDDDPVSEFNLTEELDEYKRGGTNYVLTVRPPYLLQYRRESEEKLLDYENIQATEVPKTDRLADIQVEEDQLYLRALLEVQKRKRNFQSGSLIDLMEDDRRVYKKRKPRARHSTHESLGSSDSGNDLSKLKRPRPAKSKGDDRKDSRRRRERERQRKKRKRADSDGSSVSSSSSGDIDDIMDKKKTSKKNKGKPRRKNREKNYESDRESDEDFPMTKNRKKKVVRRKKPQKFHSSSSEEDSSDDLTSKKKKESKKKAAEIRRRRQKAFSSSDDSDDNLSSKSRKKKESKKKAAEIRRRRQKAFSSSDDSDDNLSSKSRKKKKDEKTVKGGKKKKKFVSYEDDDDDKAGKKRKGSRDRQNSKKKKKGKVEEESESDEDLGNLSSSTELLSSRAKKSKDRRKYVSEKEADDIKKKKNKKGKKTTGKDFETDVDKVKKKKKSRSDSDSDESVSTHSKKKSKKADSKKSSKKKDRKESILDTEKAKKNKKKKKSKSSSDSSDTSIRKSKKKKGKKKSDKRKGSDASSDSEFDIDEIVDDDSPLSRSVSELKVKKKKKDNRKVVSDLEPDYIQKRKGGKEKKKKAPFDDEYDFAPKKEKLRKKKAPFDDEYDFAPKKEKLRKKKAPFDDEYDFAPKKEKLKKKESVANPKLADKVISKWKKVKEKLTQSNEDLTLDPMQKRHKINRLKKEAEDLKAKLKKTTDLVKKYEAEDEDMDLNEISDETMKDQPDGKKSKKNAKGKSGGEFNSFANQAKEKKRIMKEIATLKKELRQFSKTDDDMSDMYDEIEDLSNLPAGGKKKAKQTKQAKKTPKENDDEDNLNTKEVTLNLKGVNVNIKEIDTEKVLKKKKEKLDKMKEKLEEEEKEIQAESGPQKKKKEKLFRKKKKDLLQKEINELLELYEDLEEDIDIDLNQPDAEDYEQNRKKKKKGSKQKKKLLDVEVDDDEYDDLTKKTKKEKKKKDKTQESETVEQGKKKGKTKKGRRDQDDGDDDDVFFVPKFVKKKQQEQQQKSKSQTRFNQDSDDDDVISLSDLNFDSDEGGEKRKGETSKTAKDKKKKETKTSKGGEADEEVASSKKKKKTMQIEVEVEDSKDADKKAAKKDKQAPTKKPPSPSVPQPEESSTFKSKKSKPIGPDQSRTTPITPSKDDKNGSADTPTKHKHEKKGFDTGDFYRGGNILNYSLSSKRCMDDGWTIPPDPIINLLEPPPQLFSQDADEEYSIINRYESKFVQLFYSDGKSFINMFPDGTGTVWYKSGNVALSLISTEHKGKSSLLIHENISSKRSPKLLGIFEPNGNCTCYYPNGCVRANLTPFGGEYFSMIGQKLKRWKWRHIEAHIQAPPFQPVTFRLSKYVTVRMMSQEQIFIAFSDGKRSARFNVGTKLKISSESIPEDTISKALSELQKKSVYLETLMQKLHYSWRFLHSPRRMKVRLPNYLNSKVQRMFRPVNNYTRKITTSPLLQVTTNQVPAVSASVKLPPIVARKAANYEEDEQDEKPFSVTVN